MPDAFDLSKYLRDNNVEPMQSFATDRDLSGKPKPENVRAVLNSGIEVKCELKYDGIDKNGMRRHFVIAEIDWENYWPTTLVVGVFPTDCVLSLKVPDDSTEAEDWARAGSLNVVIEKEIFVPSQRV